MKYDVYLVSERKIGIFSKIKSKIPDFERGKAKIAKDKKEVLITYRKVRTMCHLERNL